METQKRAVAILKLGHEEFDLRARHEFRKNERARFLSAAPLERMHSAPNMQQSTTSCGATTEQRLGIRQIITLHKFVYFLPNQ
jgi:hypothetical protein